LSKIFAFSVKNAILTTSLITHQQRLTISNSSSVLSCGFFVTHTTKTAYNPWHNMPPRLSYSEFRNDVWFVKKLE